jgi:hypothetical protein
MLFGDDIEEDDTDYSESDQGDVYMDRDGELYRVDEYGKPQKIEGKCDEKEIYGKSAIYSACGWVITNAGNRKVRVLEDNEEVLQQPDKKQRVREQQQQQGQNKKQQKATTSTPSNSSSTSTSTHTAANATATAPQSKNAKRKQKRKRV